MIERLGQAMTVFFFLVCNNITYSCEIHEISSSPEKRQNVDSEKVKLTSVKDFLESGAVYSVQKIIGKIAISILDKVNLTTQNRSLIIGVAAIHDLFWHKSCSDMLKEASYQFPMSLSIIVCCTCYFIPVRWRKNIVRRKNISTPIYIQCYNICQSKICYQELWHIFSDLNIQLEQWKWKSSTRKVASSLWYLTSHILFPKYNHQITMPSIFK